MHNMEKNGRDGDDIGSGWLEVKKKHRSNTKLSIAQSIGSGIARPELLRKGQVGFSQNHTSISGQGRQISSNKSSSSRNPQKNENDERNELNKKTMLENKESDIRVQVHNSQVLEEETVKKIVEHSLQFGEIKPSVQAIGDYLENVELKDRATIRKHVQENCVRDTSNIVNLEVVSPIAQVPKIKWGNLEEDELKGTDSTVMGTELNKHQNLDGLYMVEDKRPLVVSAAHVISKKNDSSGRETSRIAEEMEEAVFSDASCGNSKMASVNSESDMLMESSMDIPGKSEVSVKQLNEKSTEIEEFCKVQGDSSIQNESAKVDECRSKPLSISDETELASSQDPNSGSKDDCCYSLEITIPNKVSAASEEIQESVSPIDNIDGYEGRENSPKFENISTAEDTNTTKDTMQLRAPAEIISADSQVDREKFNEDRSIAENLLINAFEKGETGESKERFRQRLWCFLFENLNRAVDELYLLCELECDVEQMKEAVLVLEEAQSDFRELKTRVDGFDKARESSFASQTLSNATTVSAKVEHRRPHALSWEVRRMASSPRRAEILSSSLEAFKKIQEESASKNATRSSKRRDTTYPPLAQSRRENVPGKSSATARDSVPTSKEVSAKLKGKQIYNSESGNRGSMGEKKHAELVKSAKEISSEARMVQKNPHFTSPQLSGKREGNSSTCNGSSSSSKVELFRPVSEMDAASTRRLKLPLSENRANKNGKGGDPFRRQSAMDKEKDRRPLLTKTLDAWKEKRNWEDILASPLRSCSRTAHSPIVSRRSTERVRVLHDKLMSPERRRKSPLDMKKEADEKHARATRIRRELENERAQRLQRVSEKLTRVSELQAVRNSKLREGMHARQQRGESRHEAYLAQISRRASDESNKVSEVRFITSLNEENKKLSLRQKLQDSELRRAERLQNIKIKQKEDIAREEAVLERRKLLEAEKLQRLAEIQRKKEEALARRDEERKAASAAREAKAVEQVRKKEVRAKAQREEAELQAQKLAERLTESELRRKVYLEQIREKASMDFREQASPSSRRPSSKDGQQRSALNQSSEGYSATAVTGFTCVATSSSSSLLQQQSFKKRVKKIRQRLMALKYEFVEPPVGIESNGLGTIAVAGAARLKIGRWLQDLQRLQQARKAGAASTGLIIGEMIKYLEGKEAELHAARQAGLLDFIASALPASHTSKPEACQTTISLLRIMKVVLALAANRSYFIARNLLPPLIPMLSTALENYCTIAASNNSYAGVSGNTNTSTDKFFDEKLETIGEVLGGLLWSVAAIMGHTCSDDRQLQMQDDLAELIVACKVIHHLRDLFSLFDRPQIEGAPFPAPVLLGLKLLGILTCKRGNLSFEGWEACSTPVVMLPAIQKFESADNEGTLASVQDSSSEKITEYYPFEWNSKEGTQISEPGLIKKEEAKSELPALEENEELKNAVCENVVNTKQSESTRVNMANISPEEAATWEWTKSCSSQMKGGGKSAEEAKTEPDNTSSEKVDDQRVLARNRSEKMPGAITNRSIAFLVSVIAETGLVGLPSLLTAVLLQANPRANSEQAAYMLPVNFEEVATGVLKIMNNLAHLNLNLVQSMLARPDLQMEFFHLMSFLLSHCTGKWKTTTDQVALLLFETLLLLGYFALLHSGNQAVLRWGKSPTILHKICDLPFAFFSDPQLTPVLVGTLLAVCYGCEQNRDVVQQELSMDMLLVLLKSSKQDLQASPDSKQMIVPRVGIQLDVQSNSISYQSGTMDVIMEESEEEMQSIQEKDTSLNSQEMSRKLPAASPVADNFSLSHQQPNAKPCKISLISDHANSIKRSNRIVSKSASQGDSALKESISTRINTTGKAAKGKLVSSNKEFSANQGKCSRVPNPESVQRAPMSISSKRSGSVIFPDLKTSSSIGLHSHGLKVAKEYPENFLLSPAFKLSNRFPVNLIDHAQEFFAAGLD
ncbi:uncharacterized protein LOC131076214 isoform X1 [Cryptomeria japonica]|uniref:uncharacterized protein LOC131076214 isoform X1 n=1 Tax=Cryptomeria japonica TaxID=3369 RepID=UPI0025AC2C8A|nr:uncharacterized protein LOC131076214 isoform X1 [Cryptomeria japonica]XP_057869267.1 uncharacterized protein LOC131076214 isoform X1 [Cryptomeria japonica]XP_057869268.1 uncharacterized protein LOC131076214 isoform X1 [Cryptomeria japonica]